MPKSEDHKVGAQLARLSANARKIKAILTRIECLPKDVTDQQLDKIVAGVDAHRKGLGK